MKEICAGQVRVWCTPVSVFRVSLYVVSLAIVT